MKKRKESRGQQAMLNETFKVALYRSYRFGDGLFDYLLSAGKKSEVALERGDKSGGVEKLYAPARPH